MRRHVPAASSLLASSGVSAALPLLVLVTSARSLSVHETSVVALSLTLTAYGVQILGASTVESRLPAQPFRPPGWTVAVALVCCPGALVSLASPVLGVALVLPMFAGLEVSRVISVAFGRARVETKASAALGLASVVAYLVPAFWMSVLAIDLGIVAAIMLRYRVGASAPPRRRRGWQWILVETGVTGVTQPLVMIALISGLGASAAIAFRTITSVVSVLSPVLGFVRIRLLAAPRRHDLVLGYVLCGLAAAAISALHLTHVLDAALGAAYDDVTWLAMTVALLWKVASLGSVSPFASLRRLGRFKLVVAARSLSAAVYLIAALIAAYSFRSVSSVFVAFLFAEVLTWITYSLAARRIMCRSSSPPWAVRTSWRDFSTASRGVGR